VNLIRSYSRIRSGTLSFNGQALFSMAAGAPATFLTEAYKHLALQYPKFHKMDLLCKLGIIGAEPVLGDATLAERELLTSTALVFSNRASSLDTDRQHQASISDKGNYFPSPAVFVYTLPNIVIGELAIRHKITGENAFLVSESFDAELMVSYTDALLASTDTKAVLCGWTEVDANACESLIYLVERPDDSNKNSNFKPHSSETLKLLYNV